MDSGADFKAGKPRNGNEMCFIFSEYSICDHENSWSNDLGILISMIFFFLSKKRPKIMITWSYKLLFLWSMIHKAVISWFWSQQILWSRDYDLRKTMILNFKIIISRDLVIMIPTISVITVIMDHGKWILMCAKLQFFVGLGDFLGKLFCQFFVIFHE